MAERVGCGTPCLFGSLVVREVVGSRPGRGNSKESFSSNQETGKVFSREMPFYSKFYKILKYVVPRGEVYVTDHLRLPLMRHPATLKTMPILANYYYALNGILRYIYFLSNVITSAK